MIRSTIILLVIIFTIFGCDKENPTEPSNNNNNTGGCTDNNSFNCATELQIGITKQDQIESQGDLDYFKFTTSTPGVLEISVDNVPSNVDMDVYVYDAQQNQIASSTGTQNGQSVFFEMLRVPGTYYLKLQGGYWSSHGNDKYTVLVNLDASDTYEMNNTFSEAKLISLNNDIQGKIRPTGDVDYFKFITNSPGIIEITVENVPSNIDMDVYLFDSQQNQVANSTGTTNGQSVFMFVLANTGTYFIKINGGYWSGGSTQFYKFSIKVDASDTYEVNNAFSEAKLISLNTNIQGKIRPSGDWDFFKFNVSSIGNIQVVVDPVPSSFGMDIYVYDTQQNQIAYSTGTSNGQPIYLNVNLTSIGTYYVKLGDYWGGNSTQFYTLKINK
ncbi:MAG: PPC domain-containing protein [Ignavibacteriae bacterium]|nr:PPC domain-containing protein [Ignavibacteriota bacterium]